MVEVAVWGITLPVDARICRVHGNAVYRSTSKHPWITPGVLFFINAILRYFVTHSGTNTPLGAAWQRRSRCLHSVEQYLTAVWRRSPVSVAARHAQYSSAAPLQRPSGAMQLYISTAVRKAARVLRQLLGEGRFPSARLARSFCKNGSATWPTTEYSLKYTPFAYQIWRQKERRPQALAESARRAMWVR
jgi:hypothetical protein